MSTTIYDLLHPPQPKSSFAEQAALSLAFLGLTGSTMLNLLAICSDALREHISDETIIYANSAVMTYIFAWASISQSWEVLKGKPENKERIVGEFKATLFMLPILGFFIVGVPLLFFMNDEHKMAATVSTALTESFLLFSSLTTGAINMAQRMKKIH